MRKLLFCFGTRPEAIKMAPIIAEAKNEGFQTLVCLTGQHREMLTPFLTFFNITADFNLDVMKPNQSLAEMTSNILLGVTDVLKLCTPDLVIVQGDTTSTFASGLAAFYLKIPVVHVEAGLRTFNKYSPFPEEINRKMVSTFSECHFPPTETTKMNLEKEGYFTNVVVTGNTSIDALRLTTSLISQKKLDQVFLQKHPLIDFSKKLLLVTTHRRENHGEPLDNICKALLKISDNNLNVEIVLPVHLNPQVKTTVESILGKNERIHLLPPLEYPEFVWFMQKSYLILTDSGGVQEEGPYFKKPILVLRRDTERPEGIEAGTSILIGTDKNIIIDKVQNLLDHLELHNQFFKSVNPYGDGFASKAIIKKINLLK